jgi:hypothetical protein
VTSSTPPPEWGDQIRVSGIIPVSKELLQEGGHGIASWIAKELHDSMIIGPTHGPKLPESDSVRDETETDDPDAWLVWDDSDYYGPHLVGVCRTRVDAITKARARAAERYGPPLREMYIEGVAFDIPTPEEA